MVLLNAAEFKVAHSKGQIFFSTIAKSRDVGVCAAGWGGPLGIPLNKQSPDLFAQLTLDCCTYPNGNGCFIPRPPLLLAAPLSSCLL